MRHWSDSSLNLIVLTNLVFGLLDKDKEDINPTGKEAPLTLMTDIADLPNGVARPYIESVLLLSATATSIRLNSSHNYYLWNNR